MKRVIAFIALACLTTVAFGTDEIPSLVVLKIDLPEWKQDELAAVRVDAQVFGLEPDLLRLRIRDTSDKVVPFLLRKRQTSKSTATRRVWNSHQFTGKPLENGGLEITLTLGEKDPQPTSLRFVTALRDFEQRVRVETSADGKEWKPAGTETLIFDYARYLDVRNDVVPLPTTTDRHFRLVIDDVTVEQESELLTLTRRLQGKDEADRTEKTVIDRRPFRIDRLELLREVQEMQAAGDAKTTYESRFYVVTDPQKKQTTLGVSMQGEPLTSLTLETSDRNFSRHAVVEAMQIRSPHGRSRVGEATLSRIDFKTLQREDLTIEFPETRSRSYHIVIDDRDSPPLTITGVRAEGNEYELVFLATPGNAYRLEYGRAVAAESHDTAAISELLRANFQPTPVTLGERVLVDQPAEPGDRVSKLLNNRLLIFGVIGLLVVVLGWGLFSAMKRMDQLPRE